MHVRRQTTGAGGVAAWLEELATLATTTRALASQSESREVVSSPAMAASSDWSMLNCFLAAGDLVGMQSALEATVMSNFTNDFGNEALGLSAAVEAMEGSGGLPYAIFNAAATLTVRRATLAALSARCKLSFMRVWRPMSRLMVRARLTAFSRPPRAA